MVGFYFSLDLPLRFPARQAQSWPDRVKKQWRLEACHLLMDAQEEPDEKYTA
jgi:hypothetical protein